MEDFQNPNRFGVFVLIPLEDFWNPFGGFPKSFEIQKIPRNPKNLSKSKTSLEIQKIHRNPKNPSKFKNSLRIQKIIRIQKSHPNTKNPNSVIFAICSRKRAKREYRRTHFSSTTYACIRTETSAQLGQRRRYGYS